MRRIFNKFYLKFGNTFFVLNEKKIGNLKPIVKSKKALPIGQCYTYIIS